MRLVRLLGAFVAGAVLLAACGGGDTSQTQTERDLETELAKMLAPASVANTKCVDDPPMARGSTFFCEAEVAGSFYEVQLHIVDDQGRFTFERRHAVFKVIDTETQLGADASSSLGRQVTADCGDQEYLVVMVLNNFTCTLETETGATRSIEVLVKNADRQVEWSLLDG